jgi:hypothetical protein
MSVKNAKGMMIGIWKNYAITCMNSPTLYGRFRSNWKNSAIVKPTIPTNSQAAIQRLFYLKTVRPKPNNSAPNTTRAMQTFWKRASVSVTYSIRSRIRHGEAVNHIPLTTMM